MFLIETEPCCVHYHLIPIGSINVHFLCTQRIPDMMFPSLLSLTKARDEKKSVKIWSFSGTSIQTVLKVRSILVTLQGNIFISVFLMGMLIHEYRCNLSSTFLWFFFSETLWHLLPSLKMLRQNRITIPKDIGCQETVRYKWFFKTTRVK